MNTRTLFLTEDGSHTLLHEEWGEIYHSRHGAIAESLHVYIQTGLVPALTTGRLLHILEMGFGTGLNALLTLEATADYISEIHYHTIEKYPLTPAEWKPLNYPALIRLNEAQEYFRIMHNATSGHTIALRPGFIFTREVGDILDFLPITEPDFYDLIYYDAFAPEVQPELWTEKLFTGLCRLAKKGATLVTYSAKGSVKRLMIAGGWSVEKCAGPPGKREMIRAVKEE